MVKKVLFIINPHSGVDRNKALQSLIGQYLDPAKFSVEIAHTAYAGHGTELAREGAAAGASIIVAVGGDGSVNDVIRGIKGSSATLAIVPKGSGNGLARSLGIPLQPEAAIKLIGNGRVQTIDLGLANDIVFAANIGVGFDAEVAQQFAGSKGRGFRGYAGIVFRLLWRYKIRRWTITIEGETKESEAFMLNVANAKQFGYNFKIAPLADLQDGLFDIITIKKFPRIIGGLIVLRAFTGSILKSRFVTFSKASALTISHPEMTYMQADGDFHACGNTLDIAILPAALKVLAP